MSSLDVESWSLSNHKGKRLEDLEERGNLYGFFLNKDKTTQGYLRAKAHYTKQKCVSNVQKYIYSQTKQNYFLAS